MKTVIYLSLCFLFLGCSANPVKEADTFEQKAYAAYGVFVIYQGKAAQLKQDPTVPESAKRILSRADLIAYPASLVLLDAATIVTDTRELLEKCQTIPPLVEEEECKNTSEEKLNIALTSLSQIYFDTKPKLLAIKTTFDEVKKSTTRTP